MRRVWNIVKRIPTASIGILYFILSPTFRAEVRRLRALKSGTVGANEEEGVGEEVIVVKKKAA